MMGVTGDLDCGGPRTETRVLTIIGPTLGRHNIQSSTSTTLQASDMKASMINALAFKVYQLEKVNSN